MADQLTLPFMRVSRLPFEVRRNALGRATRSELARYADQVSSNGFVLRALIEDEALLAELRARCGETARGAKRPGRPSKGAAAQFAGTIEGRRVYQMIDQVSERIESRREFALCG